MSRQITLELPNEVLSRVERLAALVRRKWMEAGWHPCKFRLSGGSHALLMMSRRSV
jgi:hypothetical protein